MKPEAIIEKLEELASAAERESMCGKTTGYRAAQLRGCVEGLRDAMKVFNRSEMEQANKLYLWLVEQYQWNEEKQEWKEIPEICGVFDTEQKAVDACIDEGYWIVRMELNKAMPHETTPVFIKGEWEPYYPWIKEDGTWDDKPMIRTPKE